MFDWFSVLKLWVRMFWNFSVIVLKQKMKGKLHLDFFFAFFIQAELKCDVHIYDSEGRCWLSNQISALHHSDRPLLVCSVKEAGRVLCRIQLKTVAQIFISAGGLNCFDLIRDITYLINLFFLYWSISASAFSPCFFI